MQVLERHKFTYESLIDIQDTLEGTLKSALQLDNGDFKTGYTQALQHSIEIVKVSKDVLEEHCAIFGDDKFGQNT